MHYYDTSIPDHDEGLARAADVGARAHLIIASLAAQDGHPSHADLKAAVTAALAGFRPVEKRAHRQTLLSDVTTYFTHLRPPQPWNFERSEGRLDTGRVDLIWSDPDGRILLDELKTGQPRTLHTTRTQLQIASYIAAAREIWGGRFLGLRLLSTYDHRESRFIDPTLASTSLHSTPFGK